MAEAVGVEWPASWPAYEAILRLAREMADRHNDAHELVQSAIARGLVRTAEGDELKLGWFVTVMRNLKRDHARKRSRAREVELDAELEPSGLTLSVEMTPQEVLMNKETVEHLLGAIRGLPERKRRMVFLAYIEGRTNRAIAAEMGVSVATVERDRATALEALARELGPRGGQGYSGVLALAMAGAGARKLPRVAAGVGAYSAADSMLAIALFVFIAAPLAMLLRAATSGGPPLEVEGPDVRAAAATERVQSESVAQATFLRLEGSERVVPSPFLHVDASEEQAAAPEADGQGTSPGRFVVTLIVDGVPAGSNWRALTPRLDPDVYERSIVRPPKCKVFDRDPVGGRFGFAIPEAGGVWLFRFTDQDSGLAIWLRGSGQPGTERTVQIETAAFGFEPSDVPGLEGFVFDEQLLMNNTEPGCWAVVALKVDPECPSRLRCKRAAIGVNHVISEVNSFAPDQWVRDAQVEVLHD